MTTTSSISAWTVARVTTNNPRENETSGVRITVTGLRARRNGSEVTVGILLENGEHREREDLPLTMEQYLEIKPERGAIDGEAYERICEASRFCGAFRAGENLLAYGSNSKQALARKIMQRGFEREIAYAAAEKLEEMGLIDEEGDLCREVEKCLKKLWGERRIATYLRTRGFSAGTLEGLPDALESVDFPENCAELIRKHYGGVPSDPAEKQKMIAGLARYGYTLAQIKEAIRR